MLLVVLHLCTMLLPEAAADLRQEVHIPRPFRIINHSVRTAMMVQKAFDGGLLIHRENVVNLRFVVA